MENRQQAARQEPRPVERLPLPKASTGLSSSGLRGPPVTSSTNAAMSSPPRQPTAVTLDIDAGFNEERPVIAFSRSFISHALHSSCRPNNARGTYARIATIGTSMFADDFIQVVNANDQAAFVGTLSRDANRGAAFYRRARWRAKLYFTR